LHNPVLVTVDYNPDNFTPSNSSKQQACPSVFALREKDGRTGLLNMVINCHAVSPCPRRSPPGRLPVSTVANTVDMFVSTAVDLVLAAHLQGGDPAMGELIPSAV